jgi:hypothetical protein
MFLKMVKFLVLLPFAVIVAFLILAVGFWFFVLLFS